MARSPNLWTRIQQLQDYITTNGVDNRFVVAGVPGASEDVNSGYNKYDLVVNSLTDRVYQCTDTTADAAVWEDTGLDLDKVTEIGKEIFVVDSEEDQLALQANLGDICIRTDAGIYVRNAGTEGDITDWTLIDVSVAQTSTINDLRTYLSNGLLQIGTLAISDTAEQFKTTTTAYFRISGIQLSKTATDALTFTAADTINVAEDSGTFFGVWLVQVNAAGTISTKSPASDQVYTTAELALAALPAVDTGNVALGSIVIGATEDASWTANTDDMTPASDCASATFTDASLVSLPDAIA